MGVLEVQKLLSKFGFNPGPLDGIWGPKTAAAVRAFQKFAGASVTGQIDDELEGYLGEWDANDRTKASETARAEGGEVDNDGTKAPEDTGPKALPRGARLVRVGSNYRVLWELPEGIGTVWYSISTEQLVQIYDDDWESDVVEVYSNTGAYEAKYGDLAWGNIAEVNMTSEDPWQDMYERILNSFGYVAGMETDEVRNLVIQAYFERWDPNVFLSYYKKTDYYNSQSDLARSWDTTSDEEKKRKITSKAQELVEYYRRKFGVDPEGGINNQDILAAAEGIASGTLTQGEWEYTTRKAAEEVATSPAARDVIEDKRAQGEQEVLTENYGQYAMDEWYRWMGGAVPIPNGFVEKWGNDLFMKTASEADLEQYLKSLSLTYYPNKDENTSWADWAAIPKSYIQNLLELPNVSDADGLLDEILQSGATGYDMRVLIKNDPRYMNTKGALSELSSKVHNLGTMMGFTPGGSI